MFTFDSPHEISCAGQIVYFSVEFQFSNLQICGPLNMLKEIKLCVACFTVFAVGVSKSFTFLLCCHSLQPRL